MKMRRTRLGLMRAAAFIAVALMIAATAGATALERMSLAKIAVAAPVIVRARCAENSVARAEGEIWTVTTFNVEETWRGSASTQVIVRLLGGRMGDVTSHVSGVPRFTPGEDVVLFLQPTTRGDYSVVSWEQGTFRIHQQAYEQGTYGQESNAQETSGAQATVTQDTAAFATFDPATRQFRPSGIRNMPLDEFRARVKAALQPAEVKQP